MNHFFNIVLLFSIVGGMRAAEKAQPLALASGGEALSTQSLTGADVWTGNEEHFVSLSEGSGSLKLGALKEYVATLPRDTEELKREQVLEFIQTSMGADSLERGEDKRGLEELSAQELLKVVKTTNQARDKALSAADKDKQDLAQLRARKRPWYWYNKYPLLVFGIGYLCSYVSQAAYVCNEVAKEEL